MEGLVTLRWPGNWARPVMVSHQPQQAIIFYGLSVRQYTGRHKQLTTISFTAFGVQIGVKLNKNGSGINLKVSKMNILLHTHIEQPAPADFFLSR